MLFIDLRDPEYKPDTVPEHAWVPLSQVYLVVEVGKSTVYRWYAKDWIEARELFIDGEAPVLYVQMEQVRRVKTRLRQIRHAERRRLPLNENVR